MSLSGSTRYTLRPWPLMLALTAVIATLVLLQAAANANEAPAASAEQAAAPAAVNVDQHTCRYGLGVLSPNKTAAWLDTLGVGWYITFGTSPISPSRQPQNNAEFVYTLRMQNGVFNPPLSDITGKLAENPGALWLVGSEQEVRHPDSGDNTYPADYAAAYHEAYEFIKQRDPTAQVGIGGMSMATPGRLQYLDIAWDTYRSRYGRDMPVDVWNVHIYIFAERLYGTYENGHGKIALGTDPAIAIQSSGGNKDRCPRDDVYCLAEHDSVEIFKSQLIELRKWMKNRGQQDKPLIITEFSLLYQPGYADEFGAGWPPSRVNAYMNATTSWLNSYTDANLGYPQDNYRLVQQWAWYTTFTRSGDSGYASNILKSDYDTSYPAGSTDAYTEVGVNYDNIVAGVGRSVNLKAAAAQATQVADNSADLRVTFFNNGSTSITRPFQVTFYADAALTQVIGAATVNPTIRGCARYPYSAAVRWNNLAQGQHNFWVKVDSQNEIGETNEGDNVSSGAFTIQSPGGYATPTSTPAGPTSTATPTPPATATPTQTPTMTPTPTPVGHTATPTPTHTPAPPATATATATPKNPSDPTATATATATPAGNGTATPTATATATAVPDITPPTLTWINPVADGEVYTVDGEAVQLEVSATDDTAVAEVQFHRWDAASASWVLIAAERSAPYRAALAADQLTTAWVQVVARAYDTSGNPSDLVHIWLRRADSPELTPTPPPTATSTMTPTATQTATATQAATATPTPAPVVHRAFFPFAAQQ
jgi:hypothetical protein